MDRHSAASRLPRIRRAAARWSLPVAALAAVALGVAALVVARRFAASDADAVRVPGPARPDVPPPGPGAPAPLPPPPMPEGEDPGPAPRPAAPPPPGSLVLPSPPAVTEEGRTIRPRWQLRLIAGEQCWDLPTGGPDDPFVLPPELLAAARAFPDARVLIQGHAKGYLPFLRSVPLEDILREGRLPPLSLTRTVPLEGVVVDPRGNPEPGGRVIARSSDDGSPARRGSLLHAPVGADGTFRFEALGPGRHALVALHPPSGRSGRLLLDLEPGRPSGPVTLVLNEEALAVAGVVQESDGRPAANLVLLLCREGRIAGTARAGVDGAFRILGGEAGEPLRIEAEWPGRSFGLDVTGGQSGVVFRLPERRQVRYAFEGETDPAFQAAFNIERFDALRGWVWATDASGEDTGPSGSVLLLPGRFRIRADLGGGKEGFSAPFDVLGAPDPVVVFPGN